MEKGREVCASPIDVLQIIVECIWDEVEKPAEVAERVFNWGYDNA